MRTSGFASPWDARDGFQLGGTRAVALADRGRRRERDCDHQLWHVGRGSRGRRRARGERRQGVRDADGTIAEAYVLRNGRQTKVHLKDFAVGAGAEGGTMA